MGEDFVDEASRRVSQAVLATLIAALVLTVAVAAAITGYTWATRSSPVLIELAAADRASARALDEFRRVLETTDFCDGGGDDGQ